MMRAALRPHCAVFAVRLTGKEKAQGKRKRGQGAGRLLRPLRNEKEKDPPEKKEKGGGRNEGSLRRRRMMGTELERREREKKEEESRQLDRHSLDLSGRWEKEKGTWRKRKSGGSLLGAYHLYLLTPTRSRRREESAAAISAPLLST